MKENSVQSWRFRVGLKRLLDHSIRFHQRPLRDGETELIGGVEVDPKGVAARPKGLRCKHRAPGVINFDLRLEAINAY